MPINSPDSVSLSLPLSFPVDMNALCPVCSSPITPSPSGQHKKYCTPACRSRANNKRSYSKRKSPPSCCLASPQGGMEGRSPPTPKVSPSPEPRLWGYRASTLLAALEDEIESLCQKREHRGVECWYYVPNPSKRRREGLWRFSSKGDGSGGIQVSLPMVDGKRKKVALGRAYLALRGDIPLGYLVAEGELPKPQYEYSHLCHHPGCCNPSHGVAETPDQNKARYGCHSGENRMCPHTPKCLLMGEKANEEASRREKRVYCQVVSQEIE